MFKPRVVLIAVAAGFLIWAGYLMIHSLERPDHIHSRDDNPQQQSTEDPASLELMLENDPDNFELIVRLGHLYIENQQFDRAEKIFEKAVQLQPENAEMWVDLGMSQRQGGDYDEALKTLKNATEKFPGYGESWLQLAVLYRTNLNENKKAQECFEKFMMVDPGSNLIPRVKQEIELIRAEMKE
ncbi:MAG: tetratricopeptide repeat protein [Calditrichia bacterium]